MTFTENETTELKEIYVEDIRKEIIAFANSNGGTIYVGVRDNGEVLGLDDPDYVNQQIANSCRDSIKPDITMFLQYERIEIAGKFILAVHVQRGTARPYYIGAKGLRSSGVFVRQGTTSAPASDAAIRQMIKDTDGDSFESMRSINQSLTFIEAEQEFALRGVEFGEPQRRTLGLLNPEGMYTNLALLLSDQCPHIIKAATFQGREQETFHDRKEFTGSLLKQLKDAYAYLDLRNQLRATFSGLYRVDRRDYAEEALREILINAIVHRDYGFSASTLISVYEDRVEIVSYGGLSGAVTLQDVLYGLSVCRNPMLANLFYRLNLIEAYGTGLRRVLNSYRDLPGRPEFLAGPNSFKAVLPNRNSLLEQETEIAEFQGVREGSSWGNYSGKSRLAQAEEATGKFDTFGKNRQKEPSAAQPKDRTILSEEEHILQLLTQRRTITRADVEQSLSVSASTAVRLLKRMRDAGRVTAIGKGKRLHYQLP